ncbi:MAG: hypothetical protein EBZ33_00095 [Flavobacteriia bacterium]|nr:hypothetical protein [Flavobacteriia bacterium]
MVESFDLAAVERSAFEPEKSGSVEPRVAGLNIQEVAVALPPVARRHIAAQSDINHSALLAGNLRRYGGASAWPGQTCPLTHRRMGREEDGNDPEEG